MDFERDRMIFDAGLETWGQLWEVDVGFVERVDSEVSWQDDRLVFKQLTDKV